MELRAVGQISVFGERIVLPASGVFDGLPAPDASGAVEIEECAAAGARAMLDDKVAVEEDGLHLSEQRIVAIEIGPAGLDHADGRILEVRDGAPEEIGFREEVGVEDADEFALSALQPVFEGTGFKAGTIRAVNVTDWQAVRGKTIDAVAGDLLGFVGGIVENLDIEKLTGIVEAGNSFDEALDHVTLVEDRQLNRNAGPM